MTLNITGILGTTDHLEKILITHKVESREIRSLTLEILTQRSLNIREQLLESFQGSLKIESQNVENTRLVPVFERWCQSFRTL
jgi:hypothetical protein